MTPESSNFREIKVPKLSARNHGADSGRFGGGGALSNSNHLLALREEMRDGQKTGMTKIMSHSRV